MNQTTSTSKTRSRDLELLFELGSLRYVQRGWLQHLGIHCANNLEHSFRVAFVALMLARRTRGGGSEEKILKMALLHDVAETRTTDLSYVQKVYVQADEARAVHDAFMGTSISDFETVIQEYESRTTLEAKLVKDADNLDIDLELKELEEQGHTLPHKWQQTRRKVRDEKFYTEAARALWDELQEADPAAWHLQTNKWRLIPGAGR